MTKKKETPLRVQLLKRGAELTNGDRNKSYGTPYINFLNIAQLWEAYLSAKFMHDIKITPEDVAHLNSLQKMARTMSGVYTEDTYVDGATYFAIAGECAKEESND